MSQSLDRDELFALFGHSVDGTLSAANHERLAGIMSSSETARKLWFEYCDLETGLADWAAMEGQTASLVPSISLSSFAAQKEQRVSRPSRYWPYAAAIAILCLISAWWFRPWQASDEVNPGVAVLSRSVEAEWSSAVDERSVGAVLGPETFRLTRGAVQLDFYSGARVILEAPAEVSLISPMEVNLIAGRIRAHVPPQAEGFVVDAPDFRVVDRGTEFGVAVGKDASEVHVFQGRVEIAAANQAEAVRTLIAGQAVQHSLQAWQDSKADSSEFLNESSIAEQETRLAQTRFTAWRKSANEMDLKPETVLHYRFDASLVDDAQIGLQDVVNSAVDSASATTGRIVGCESVQGRWPHKQAVHFLGDGDRVRLRVTPSLQEITLLAWVRVQDQRAGLQALLSANSQATGSLRWELTSTGQLRLAIARDLGRKQADWEAVNSTPFVTQDRLGQWLLLVSTFDGREIRHYGNGEFIGNNAAYKPPALLIGTADLGNSPSKNVRYFHGAIDEFAILSRVLSADEIQQIYQAGKP